MTELLTQRICVYGIVQGVGFRPTVSRHAQRAGVRGSVCNRGSYVEIYAQGTREALEAFRDALKHQAPPRSAILKIEARPVPDAPEYAGFSIIESSRDQGAIFVSPDIAICDDCRRELYDPRNRRYLHPFINCTCCGPRLTILDQMPYDRERTSMKAFPMCPDCAAEYYDPATRRYDAQPVCCNHCGPEVYLIGRPERGRAAITAVRECIAAGGIAAIKGIGGFHLCCDAENEQAVALLRSRKRRPAKPFAVMMRSVETVRQACVLEPWQEELLQGHQKPIQLLPRRAGARIAPSVAPGNPKIGVMLPYAPVQLLLFDYDDGVKMPESLVMTSGNISGAPICRDDASAVQELGSLCDCMLSHNRDILIRADDSVVDAYGGEPYMVRRSRGYAPLPVAVSGLEGEVLAVGGELKNAFCIAKDELFYLSPYVGDMEDLRTVQALRETSRRLQELLEAQPRAIACDLHPGYNTVAFARELGKPVYQVQHHWAHILSCMAENDARGPVLGLSFDGTGYGTDGTIWGGELLACDARGFQRLGSVEPFWQPGGDASAREGWRIAFSLLYARLGNAERTLRTAAELGLCDERAGRVQLMMLDRRINTVRSTSLGRLFDAASAVLGIRRESTFEGEASTALQFAAERALRSGAEEHWDGPDIREDEEGGLRLRTDALFGALLERRLRGEAPETGALLFHRALAQMAAAACRRAREKTGLSVAALSGGVFQNTLLLGMTQTLLERDGFTVLRHHMVPPNDGGIALGQALAAMQALADGKIEGI